MVRVYVALQIGPTLMDCHTSAKHNKLVSTLQVQLNSLAIHLLYSFTCEIELWTIKDITNKGIIRTHSLTQTNRQDETED